jgi:hypothetical protein
VEIYHKAWEKLVSGMTGGSGKDGSITIGDLRRSAIIAMSNKASVSQKPGLS